MLVYHFRVAAQICSCDNYGAELVVNGDFSAGNTGFSSEYTYYATASPGRYGITTDPHTANFYWPSCPDHTTGSGNMMWVDASSSTSSNIWTETITGLTPNKDYLFSCWLNTLDATAPAVLQFSVNGSLIGDSLTAPATTCNWAQFCAIWNSGANTSATITITNQSLLVYGNDVGIDDISFRECCYHSSAGVTPSICYGETYLLPGGSLVTVAGIYSDTFVTTLGCDSVIVTDLSVLNNSFTSQNISICEGESFYAGGADQTTAGVFLDTLVNSVGCDSVLTTHLSILPISAFMQDVSICDGQSYFAGGAAQTTSGIYVDTLTNFLGCDSLLTTHLIVLPNSFFTLSVFICDGDSIFAGGAYRKVSGSYYDTLVSFIGCDSVLTTNLTVLPISAHTQNISICDGQSFFAGGAQQTTGGVYVDTLINYVGCDSVLTTNLAVLPNSFSSVPAFICSGDSMYLGGFFQKVSGTYYDTLVNFLGCDSVLATNLTVLQHSSFIQNISICDGELFFAGGAFQNTGGTYVDTLANQAGCDSVLITNLTVLQNSALTQYISICDGQAFYCGGSAQTQSGVYVDSLTNFLGCDSVLTTYLTVLPNSAYSQEMAICIGDSVFIGGDWQHEAGMYTDHFINYAGCDSVLTTSLSLLPVFATAVNAVICEGDTYFAGGGNQAQPGVYVDSLHANTGCDSIVTTSLAVIPKTTTDVYPEICEGEQYLAGGTWQTTGGIYFDTLPSIAGCDSAVITHLTVNPNPVVALGNDTSICSGDLLAIDAGEGYQSYLWQDQSKERTFAASEVGSYWVTVTNLFGCASSDTMVIEQLYPLPAHFLLADTVICGNIPVSVFVSGYKNYWWFDGSTDSSYTFTQEGSYWLLVTNEHGCTGDDTLRLQNVCTEDFLMPNAFSPNGDGLNDEFLPIPIHPFVDFDLMIFNRWGIQVFESDDLSRGWDGTEKGTKGELGTYVWKMDYTLEDGTKKSASGSVILFR